MSTFSSSLVVRPASDLRRRRVLALLTLVVTAVLLSGGAPGVELHLGSDASVPPAVASRASATAPAPAAAPESPAAPAPPPAPAVALTVKGGMRQPVDQGVLSSTFGPRWGRPHEGVDVSAPIGVPIRAVGPGTVVAAEPYYGYGLRTVIDHGNGLQTTYAHQSQLLVPAGTAVATGDVIGLVGCTGHCTGPHLHFEVRQDGVAVDPLRFLS